MSPTSFTLTISKWLSLVESSDTPISSPSNSPCNSRKRQRSPSPDPQPAELDTDHQRKRLQLRRSVLREIPGNIMLSPQASPEKRGGNASNPPITPAEKKKKAASSGLDLTENPRNVRRNLAEHGMLFEDEPTFEAYNEFNKYVKELVGGPRSSTMKEESAQAIRQYLRQNATEPEGDLFGKVVPMVIKDGKSGQESRKRDADGEIIRQAESFGHDEGLKRLCNCQFVKKVLPRRVETAGKKLGLTDPKPDWVFGIREPEFPDRKLPEPGRNARALIGVAPGLQYPWFAIENKGCACPMAEAENQAIRDGATLVSAQRQLAILAGWIDEKTEAVGVDQDNIAFSCTWVPDLAHIFVHWFERKELGAEGDCVYHMNKIRSYLMNDNSHVSDFRKDSHNVLEYGITLARKEKLRKLYHDIAARNTTSTSSGTSSAGS